MSQTVLIVDDEPLVCNAIARILFDEFDVDVVTSGKDAIEKLATNKYGVIVSDLMMNGHASGAKLLEHVSVHFPEVSKILMTAEIDLIDHASAIENAGVTRILRKPFSCAHLRETLREATA